MSWLLPLDHRPPIRLLPETLIGRSRRCDLRLKSREASSVHALVYWTGSSWEVKDLSSHNGTLVDGQKLAPTDTVPLVPGSEMMFGTDQERWRLATEPAAPFALSGSRHVEVVADRLSLPSVEDAEIVVSPGLNGGWVAERIATGEERPVESEDTVRAGGRDWTLYLFQAPQDTVTHVGNAFTLGNLSLHFFVRRGEEHVAIRGRAGNREINLGESVCYQVLYYLAKARLEDAAEAAGPPGEEGWRLQDEVVDYLGITKNNLLLKIHRAKDYFAEQGVLGTGALIERRRDSGEIRIGVSRLTIDAA